MKEEVAYVYEQMILSGKSFPYDNNKFKGLSSDGAFEIRIEFDKTGNITNAYPLI